MYQNVYVEEQENSRGIVHLWDDKDGYMSFPYSKFNYAYRPSSHGSYLTMTGVRCDKVFRYRKEDINLFESDLPRETRVLTDLYLESDTPSEGHTVLYFDIEVSMENGIPVIDNPNNEITSITGYDSVTKQYTVFVLDKDKQYEPFSVNENTHVVFYETEIDLLQSFIGEYWDGVSPTIITGWNSDHFDVPYLYHRTQQIFGSEFANKLSPIEQVKFSPFRSKYMIAGVSSLDYLDLYKKFTYSQQPSYTLDAIGKVELGIGKIEFEGTLDNLRKTDIHKFIEYNVRDVEIVVKLDEKLKLIELVRGICHVGHVQYEDYCYSSKFLEGTILTYLHRKGIIATNKPPGGRELMQERMEGGEKFEGAYVKSPEPGLYEWVYSLDLQSLYPSIIMSLNISPETKRGKIVDWDIYKYITREKKNYLVRLTDEKQNTETHTYSREQLEQFFEQSKYCVSSNGILYSSENKGIIPEVLEKWFAERKEYKKLMEEYRVKGDTQQVEFYNRRQHIQKIFLNSLYGVLGLPIFRFYDLDNALAVTATGQDVIKTSAKWINAMYKTMTGVDKDYCIYIDTDSLYFSAVPIYPGDGDIEKFTIATARQAESTLNDMYSVMCKQLFNVSPEQHKFVIKGEKIAKTGFWLAKKRYALATVYDLESDTSKEKLVVKGLDIVRSSFPPVFREFMTTTTTAILNGESRDLINERVLQFAKELPSLSYKRIARNTSVKNISKYDARGLSLNEFIKGTPAHVKSALSYNRLLEHMGLGSKYVPITDGDKIRYVYLKPNPFKITVLALKGYDDPPELVDLVSTHLDHNALFENELKEKLEDYYKALGWGTLPTDQNQLSSTFFSF